MNIFCGLLLRKYCNRVVIFSSSPTINLGLGIVHEYFSFDILRALLKIKSNQGPGAFITHI